MMKNGVTFYGRDTALNTSCSEVKRKSKMLPLETSNTQKNEYQRLGFIKSGKLN